VDRDSRLCTARRKHECVVCVCVLEEERVERNKGKFFTLFWMFNVNVQNTPVHYFTILMHQTGAGCLPRDR
jgi:hypothetical protein